MIFLRSFSGLAFFVLLTNDGLLADAKETSGDDNGTSECRLWLGPSALGTEDDPEFGLFAGKDFDPGEAIPDVELAIPLVDWTEPYNRKTVLDNLIVEFVESQVWTGDYAGAKWEGDTGTILAVPGIGNLANYHSGKYNIDWDQSATLLRNKMDVFESGVAHPARGAITPYYNLTMRATEKIPSGMELFANFGETWDNNLTTDDAFQDKITRWDYHNADLVLDAIVKFMDTYEEDLTPELKEDILDFMLEKILGTAAGRRAKTIRSLIPANPKKLKDVKEAGGAFMYRNQDMVKSQKWLQKRAMCVDSIRSGKSTIPEAGRGAFTTRKIKKGNVIVPSPMMHIAHGDLMEMYETVEQEDEDGDVVLEYDTSKPLPAQLLVNYAFGHRESSLLLFPIGPQVGLINHAPLGKANAYLTWSRHKYVTNNHGLQDMTPDQLAEFHKPGIVMNVIALRDISPDEEILIDYGPEWEAAWKEYIENWNSEFDRDKQWDLKAEDMRVQYKDIPFVTDLKDGVNPYPPSVATVCFLKTDEVPDGTPRRNSEDLEIFRFADDLTPDKYTGADMYVCDVVTRTEKLTDGNLYNYTVLAKIADDDIVQVINVPHSAITFVDQPYMSDIHTTGVFRHWIGLRDSDFPQAWRNLRD